MNTAISRKIIALAVMAAALLAVGPASADDTLSILDLQYQEHAGVSRMVLMANLPFMYSVHEGGEGTLIVEIDKADISRISSNYAISAQAVHNISVSNSYAGDGAEVTEFIIKYNPEYHYSHELKGRRLFISFSELMTRPVSMDISASADPRPAAATRKPRLETVEETEGDVVQENDTARPEPVEAAQAEAPVRYRLNEIALEETESGAALRLTFDSVITSDAYKVIPVGGPARFVMDFHGALNGLSNKNLDISTPFFNRVRTAQNRIDPYPVSRIVLDQNEVVEPVIEIRGQSIYLLFSDAEVPEMSAETETVEEPAESAAMPEVEPLKIETEPADAEDETAEMEATEPESKEAEKAAETPKVDKPTEEKAADTSRNPFSKDYKPEEESADARPVDEQPVKSDPEMVEQKSTPEPKPTEMQTMPEAKPVETTPTPTVTAEKEKPMPVEAKEEKAPEEIVEKTDMFATDFPDTAANTSMGSLTIPQDEKQDTEQEGQMPEPDVAPQQQSERRVIASGDAESFQTREISAAQRRYTGRIVSLEFESIPLSSLILLLGQMTDKNFLVDPSVRDVDVSISLKDVPWDQALDVILDYHGLGKVEEDNLIRIATQQKLAQEAEDRRNLLEQRALAVPLRQITKPINYAKAESLAALLRRSLSSKGEVVVDDRTNTLVISDIPSKVDEHLNLIAALDVPTKQVIIEARIIETTRDFINEFGLQYGYRSTFDTNYGNSTGLIFPNNGYSMGGFLEDIPHGRTPIAVNLPAPNATSSLMGSFSTLGGTFILDAVLTMAESDRRVRVLSRPRISASNNQRAEIKSGVEVPYQVIQNNTVSIRFREATLKLEVTPHITADGTVIMDVVVDKSSLGIQTNAGLTIQTRKATSTVRVKDGGVAVIGGVLEVSDAHTVDALPVLSKIPLLGALFRSDQKRVQNTELLIFISPRIIG